MATKYLTMPDGSVVSFSDSEIANAMRSHGLTQHPDALRWGPAPDNKGGVYQMTGRAGTIPVRYDAVPEAGRNGYTLQGAKTGFWDANTGDAARYMKDLIYDPKEVEKTNQAEMAGQARVGEMVLDGPKRIISGAHDVFTPTEGEARQQHYMVKNPEWSPKVPPMTPQEKEIASRQMMHGTANLVAGGGETALLLGAPELSELGAAALAGDGAAWGTLLKLGGSAALGQGASYGAGKIADAAGVSPEAKELAQQLAFLGGAHFGNVTGGPALGFVAKRSTPFANMFGGWNEGNAIKGMNGAFGAKEPQPGEPNIGRAYFNPDFPIEARGREAAIREMNTANQDISNRMNGMVNDATVSGAKVPVERVEGPFQDAYEKTERLNDFQNDKQQGAALDSYWTTLRDKFDGARQRGGFSPRELFDLQRGIARKINSPKGFDSEFSDLYRAHHGTLNDALGELLPELPKLNQAYEDTGAVKPLVESGAASSKTMGEEAARAVGKSIGKSWGQQLGSHGGPLVEKALGEAGGVVGSEVAGLAAGAFPVRSRINSTQFGMGTRLSQPDVFDGFIKGANRPNPFLFPPHVPGSPGNPNTRREGQINPSKSGVSAPTRGPMAWMSNGSRNLRQAGLDDETVLQLAVTAEGRQILKDASDVSVGSKGMNAVLARVGRLR